MLLAAAGMIILTVLCAGAAAGEPSAEMAVTVHRVAGESAHLQDFTAIRNMLFQPVAPHLTHGVLVFVDLQNLVGAHDNPKQGALDDFQLLRLVKSIDVASAPVAVPNRSGALPIDGD